MFDFGKVYFFGTQPNGDPVQFQASPKLEELIRETMQETGLSRDAVIAMAISTGLEVLCSKS